jgi:hypothetical protein
MCSYSMLHAAVERAGIGICTCCAAIANARRNTLCSRLKSRKHRSAIPVLRQLHSRVTQGCPIQHCSLDQLARRNVSTTAALTGCLSGRRCIVHEERSDELFRMAIRRQGRTTEILTRLDLAYESPTFGRRL